mmetsp:Transcript_12071/g.27986  ORF Transcript_12071/g.27986 Transcript_12071/m.27986 type:complete len:224 (+) Transcript_12071:1028-1699(+)
MRAARRKSQRSGRSSPYERERTRAAGPRVVSLPREAAATSKSACVVGSPAATARSHTCSVVRGCGFRQRANSRACCAASASNNAVSSEPASANSNIISPALLPSNNGRAPELVHMRSTRAVRPDTSAGPAASASVSSRTTGGGGAPGTVGAKFQRVLPSAKSSSRTPLNSSCSLIASAAANSCAARCEQRAFTSESMQSESCRSRPQRLLDAVAHTPTTRCGR